MSRMRTFEGGATRDNDETKPDYEGYLSPLVIKRYGEYMTKHRVQSDGKLRDSDNWQKGIPIVAYMKSLFRHLIDLWSVHRRYLTYWPSIEAAERKEEALCAIIFNASGYLHESLKAITGESQGKISAETYQEYLEGLRAESNPEGCGPPPVGNCEPPSSQDLIDFPESPQ